MRVIKSIGSEEVDLIIRALEGKMQRENKHLIKTETIFDMWRQTRWINDDDPENLRLFECGMRQAMQSRLYENRYFSVDTGYFVNLDQCQNIGYLELIIRNKDTDIEKKVIVRNKIKELKGLSGQMVLVPDENNEMFLTETMTEDGLLASLEADAV